MPTYNTISFDAHVPGSLRPDWTQEVFVTRRLIPYGNKENVQSAGRGNFRITVTAILAAAADLATLQSSQGATTRTLTDLFGTTYSSTALVAVGAPRRLAKNPVTIWVDLTFERLGS